MESLGDALAEAGDLVQANRFQSRALTIRIALVEQIPDDMPIKQHLSKTYRDLGILRGRAEKWVEAIDYLTKSVEIAELVYASNPNNLQFQRNLSLVRFELSDTHCLIATNHRDAGREKESLTNYQLAESAILSLMEKQIDKTECEERLAKIRTSLESIDLRDGN